MVSRLRRKLGDPPVIETIAQAGYGCYGFPVRLAGRHAVAVGRSPRHA